MFSEILKVAMINISRRMEEWKTFQNIPKPNWKEESKFNVEEERARPHMVLQIHDELLIEVPEKDLLVVKV